MSFQGSFYNLHVSHDSKGLISMLVYAIKYNINSSRRLV